MWLDFSSERYFKKGKKEKEGQRGKKKLQGPPWLSLTDTLRALTSWTGPTFLKLAGCNYFAIIKGLIGQGRDTLGGVSPPLHHLHVGSIAHWDWSFPSLSLIENKKFLFSSNNSVSFVPRSVHCERFQVLICNSGGVFKKDTIYSFMDAVLCLSWPICLKYTFILTSFWIHQTVSRWEGKNPTIR